MFETFWGSLGREWKWNVGKAVKKVWEEVSSVANVINEPLNKLPRSYASVVRDVKIPKIRLSYGPEIDVPQTSTTNILILAPKKNCASDSEN